MKILDRFPLASDNPEYTNLFIDDPVWLYYEKDNAFVQICFPNRFVMAKFLVQYLGTTFSLMGNWFTSDVKVEYPFI